MRNPRGGADAKTASNKQRRFMRAKNLSGNGAKRKCRGTSVKSFVEGVRAASGGECIFVPGAQPGVPAKLSWLGKTINAARYMCLLTHGAPKYEGAVARHTCGNGHLSCVNPGHIKWGDLGDNMSDAVHHRAAGKDVSDRINATTR